MHKPVLIGSEIYRVSSFGGAHPLSIARVSSVMDMVGALDLSDTDQFQNAPRAKPALLQQFHDVAYIKALQRIERDQYATEQDQKKFNVGTLSNPIFPHMFKRPATSVGCSLLGADCVAAGVKAYALGGGLHHGMAGFANGFCFLNDLVFAIRHLQALGLGRVAYVDLDAHHPDGVEAAFPDEENLLIISTHEENRWPFLGRLKDNKPLKNLNIPLPVGCQDSEFNLVLDDLILPVLTRFAPEVIVVQGGADALLYDPLSRLALSNNALWRALRALLDCSDRVLLTGGGGYNPWTVARLWTGFWAILNDHPIPKQLTPRARDILGSLSWNRKRNLPSYLFDTLYDPPTEGPIRREIKDLIQRLKSLHAI